MSGVTSGPLFLPVNGAGLWLCPRFPAGHGRVIIVPFPPPFKEKNVKSIYSINFLYPIMMLLSLGTMFACHQSAEWFLWHRGVASPPIYVSETFEIIKDSPAVIHGMI